MAMKDIKLRFSDDVAILYVWDLEDLKNIANKHAFYYANNWRQKELDDLWVQEPENQKSASFGRNWGYYSGMDEIKKYYIDGNIAGGKGYSSMHSMSTWTIEIAEDGTTAQGMWYSMAQETKGFDDGKAYWMFEKIGIDFIREESGWKIWHLFIGLDGHVPPGSKYADMPIEEPPGWNPQEREFGKPTIPMEAYITKYNFYPYPQQPQPYKTFSDTMSGGPEGNPNYKG